MTTSNNPDEIRAEIERTRYELGQDVDALAEKVSPTKAVSRQTNRMKDGLLSVKENIMGSPEDHGRQPSMGDRAHAAADDARSSMHGAADQARDAMGHAGDRVSGWADDAQHAVQQAPAQLRGRTAGNPLAAGLIAFGAGLLASSLIPASRVEQRAAEGLKEQAAPLVDEAKQVAQQLREDIEPAAREAAEHVKDSASEAVDQVKADGADKAQDLKSESKDAAQQVKGAAQDG
ncbi:DUF3618 domain-containing protein [Micrococcus endophyticus]|uniref:DUF3618 domain-containing protein n=1 Tax=Micrococcus endophyticus TaxID=455343 RepID=UPI00381A3562